MNNKIGLEQEANELLKLLDYKKKYEKLYTYFPSVGKYRRELYPKQMQFFEAGKHNKFRLFMGPNRCITPWTFVETPVGLVRALEVFSGYNKSVVAWAGESECVQQVQDGILKCIEPAFRFVMEDGTFFDCTSHHQVLTAHGWIEANQLVLLSNGLRYKHKVEDYVENCVEDGYLCGLQLLQEANIYQDVPPLPIYAHQHNRLIWHMDEVEHIHLRNQGGFPYVLSPDIVDQFGEFAVCAVSQPVLPLQYCNQEMRQSLSERYQNLSLLELSDNQTFVSVLYPLEHPDLVGGKRITAIVPLGLQPIIDCSVPNVNNYKAAGVYHHNSGKSFSSQFEFVLHITGKYPPWWEGFRFDKPINAWAVGQRSDTVKSILQQGLLGAVSEFGSGMIPRNLIDFDTLTDAKKADTGIQTFRVKHTSGGYSTIEFKSYEMGRRAFEGTSIDLILLDEEPPEDVYTECVLRTMTTGGIIIMNFTPLLGFSKVIENFCGGDDWTEGAKGLGRYLVHLDAWDVPHLSEADKEIMLANIPEYQKAARSKGIPQLGAGQVLTTPWEKVEIEPFTIPKHWKRCYAMDFGWDVTAIMWQAIDPDTGIEYWTHEYYETNAQVIQHAQKIKSMNKAAGFEIAGCCDPAGGGRGQHDGKQAREMMQMEYDINMVSADNSIEPGLRRMNDRLATGMIRIFSNLLNTKSEYRTLRRNENGKIIGKDHLIDCARYCGNTGVNIANNAEMANKDDWVLAQRAAEWEAEMATSGNDGWLYK